MAVLGLGAFAALRDRGADSDTQVTAAAEPPATTLAGAGDLQRESTFDAAGTTAGRRWCDHHGHRPERPRQQRGHERGRAGHDRRRAACRRRRAGTDRGGRRPARPRLDRRVRRPARAALAALPAVADGAGTEAASCATDPTGRLVARLTWLGQPALVVVVDGPPSRAVVVTAADCHPLAEVSLP